MRIKLICKEEVKDNLEIHRIFTRGNTYMFTEGKHPKGPNCIGYIKDDSGLQRWIDKEFKEQCFKEDI